MQGQEYRFSPAFACFQSVYRLVRRIYSCSIFRISLSVGMSTIPTQEQQMSIACVRFPSCFIRSWTTILYTKALAYQKIVSYQSNFLACTSDSREESFLTPHLPVSAILFCFHKQDIVSILFCILSPNYSTIISLIEILLTFSEYTNIRIS